MSRKTLVAIGLLVSMMLWITACAAPAEAPADADTAAPSTEEPAAEEPAADDGEKTVITVLRPGDEEKVRLFMDPAIEEFNANNPDIEMQAVFEGWNSWIQKYPTYFQSGTQADVVFWWDYALSDTYVADKLVPLEGYVDQEVIDLLPASIIEAVKLDGVLYSIPQGVSGFMVYYNKEIFEQAGLDPEAPPTTWDELYDYAKQITDNTDYAGLGLPGKGTTLHDHTLLLMFQSIGGQIINDDNTPRINTPEGIAALEYLKKLSEVAPSNFMELERGDNRTMFTNGELGMIISDSTWAVPGLQAKYGEDLDASIIGLAPMVEGPAGKYNYFGADGWVITNEAEAEEAGRVISFLSSEEQTYAHHVAYGGTPYTEYERSQPEFSYDFWNVFIETLEDYTMVPRMGKTHPGAGAFEKELYPVWQKYLLGQSTAEECAIEAEETINTINERFGI